MNAAMRIVLISGLSGTGKSLALELLEKLGFLCVDNLPPPLLPQLVAQYAAGSGVHKLAVSLDIRAGCAPEEVHSHMGDLRSRGHRVSMLFLEASDAVLMRRFAKSRRHHPLSAGKLTLAESIAAERQMMAPWRDMAYRVDNQEASREELAYRLQAWLALEHAGVQVVIESFGFKYGAPLNLDFVFDVRALPNPHYDAALRPLTGQDEPVRAYFAQFRTVQQMVADIAGYLNRWLPELAQQSRIHVVAVGIGCTGGQHRSVFVAEAVAERLRDYPVLVRHRQLQTP